ncbi:GIY-YIG nuclease family protein [Bacteroidota bacterium]
MFYVYILYSEKLSKYYIGQTNNLVERIKRHNSGKGNYTSKGVPWKMVWNGSKETRPEALKLEKKLKNLSQKRIQEFIKKYSSEVSSPDDAGMSGC